MTSLILAALLTQVPQPKVYATQPGGAKAGTSVELRLTSGAELERVDRLVFSHPGLSAERAIRPADRLFPEPRPIENTFKVTVAADVPPGVYELRAAGPYGVSNARRFVVSEREELLEKEPNDESAQAMDVPFGAVVNGACDPQKFDLLRFPAKKGQRVLIEGAAHRILSRAQLVLTLSDASGRVLRRASGTRQSDPLLDVTAEADGPLLLTVAEQTYKGGDEYFYRITIGAGPWIDYVDPPALKAGAETKVTLYGRGLPGGEAAGEIDGRPLEKVQVAVKAPAAVEGRVIEAYVLPGDASADVFVWRWMSSAGASNPARFLLSEEAPTAEVEPNEDPDKAPTLALPARVAGRLGRRGDKDWFLFEAKKGEKLWIEVTSQRLGLPTDPMIVLQQVTDKGVKDLAESDDPASAQGGQRDMLRRYRLTPDDPGLAWTAPEDGKYRLLVKDLYGDVQGDARCAYVLSVRAARPDFRLLAWPIEPFPAENRAIPGACVLRRGGVERVRVFVTRLEGFDGVIRLDAEGLPAGVTSSPVFLHPGDSMEEIPLQAAADAPAFAGTLKIVGKAGEIARVARAAELAWPVADQQQNPFIPRVTEGVAFALDVERPAPFTVTLGGPERTIQTARGAKIKLPVKLVRNGDYKDVEKAKVTLKAVGLPGANNQKTIAAKDVVLDAAAPQGELELDVTEKAPLGPLAISLAGEVQISYAHEPQRSKAVEEDKKRVEGVAKQAAEETKAAGEARAKAAKELEELKKKLGALKPDASEKAGLEAAVKDAGERLKTAQESEAKAKELAKAAEGALKKLADDAKKAADMSKEKKLKISAQSLAVTLEVAAAPVSLKASPITVKAEGKAEAELEIERLPGFEEELVFELAAPGAAKLSLAEPAKCGKDQKKLKVLVAAAKGAAEGEHKASLKAQIKWNGRTIPFEQPLQIKVEKAAPPPPAEEKKDAPKQPSK